MAQSRLQRISTIYGRVSSLIQSGAIMPADEPIWLSIYKAFPPKYEPTFDRTVPDTTIKDIFYQEDSIRAKFHKENPAWSAVNLLSKKQMSYTKNFLSIYASLQKEGIPENMIYDMAKEQFSKEVKLTRLVKHRVESPVARKVS